MIRHLGFIQYVALAVFILAMQGCAADDPGSSSDSYFGSGIGVSARIADHVYTRGYQETGRVESGEYYLSYPGTDRNYTLAKVDFDKEKETAPGLGIVSTLEGAELRWNLIGGSPVTFYLDNVSSSLGTGPVVNFSNGNNPFVAGLFDFENGSNDLLWGEKTVNTGTKSLGFDLHHNMSRVRVQVEVVHTENSVGEISLEDAEVEITSIHTRPEYYDRTTGLLGLAEETESVTVVAPTGDYGWKNVNEENPDNVVYTSKDIVLPPQSLAEDDTRSRLVIKLANGDEYSGILPHAMLIANGEDTQLNYPVTLSFLKEYVLTIRTVITEEPPELAFMPVWVTEWVDKGEFTLEAHQSGVYTAEEFYSLVAYYEKVNEYQLVRYGYLHTPAGSTKQEWLFNIFSSVVLDFDKINGTMKPGHKVEGKGEAKDFSFSFNNYAVYVKGPDTDETVAVDAQQLYGIVTGSLPWSQLKK